MAEYYLISQLPSLDGVGDNVPLPITEERLSELCCRFLDKKTLAELEKLTLIPPRNGDRSGSDLIEAWNEGERNLRLVLGKIRGEKLKKTFDIENKVLPLGLVQVARAAAEMESPMEAEKYLNSYRLEFLESLRPMDSFSEEYVFYYWLKLKLLLRIKQFDTERGASAYRNIYNSVLNGDRSEAEQ